eukprot:CAMPEP_0179333846 /NCGR_PEP_ID=MMETSP0797-20121207/65597_1 /TAXON_ID=47934 /ORGANISM="Dinophysis acuminata, Strain DAEP01" /LENGTH=31 /DNA_ID= /DNA_START= /DNA_END= /DNA_ORIENTATION=
MNAMRTTPIGRCWNARGAVPRIRAVARAQTA